MKKSIRWGCRALYRHAKRAERLSQGCIKVIQVRDFAACLSFNFYSEGGFAEAEAFGFTAGGCVGQLVHFRNDTKLDSQRQIV
jgi:hypothetical protein